MSPDSPPRPYLSGAGHRSARRKLDAISVVHDSEHHSDQQAPKAHCGTSPRSKIFLAIVLRVPARTNKLSPEAKVSSSHGGATIRGPHRRIIPISIMLGLFYSLFSRKLEWGWTPLQILEGM